LEHVLVFVTLLEEHAKTTTFDYSATQLLSTWLQKMLQTFPTMAREQEKLQGLAQAVSITRGLGQAEVWSVFREAVAVSDSTLVGQMLELGEKMTDPSESALSPRSSLSVQ
jgi:midasin